MYIGGRKIILLENEIRKNELDDTGIPNLCEHFKDTAKMVCDEVWVIWISRRCKVDTWWWNEEVKERITRKMHIW